MHSKTHMKLKANNSIEKEIPLSRPTKIPIWSKVRLLNVRSDRTFLNRPFDSLKIDVLFKKFGKSI